MPKQSFPGRLIIVSLMALLGVGSAQGDGFIESADIYVTPSNLEKVVADPDKFNVEAGCFSVFTGTPIDCNFTLWVSYPPATTPAYLANGGHYHDLDSRPLIYRQRHFVGSKVIYDGPGGLEYPSDINPDLNTVQGETMPAGNFPGVPYAGFATVWYPLPEVSGEVQMDVQTVIVPHDWYCVIGCYDAKMMWKRDMFHVGVQGLVEVPDPGPDDHYIKSRGQDVGHPDSVAFFIKPEHLPQLYKIANKYYAAFENDDAYQKEYGVSRPLSLNDMTLPLGGLFDINHNWSTPHNSHRDGTDADVNQTVDNVRISCLQDHILIRVLQHALPKLRDKFGKGGNTDSALWCENGGNKHIDFER